MLEAVIEDTDVNIEVYKEDCYLYFVPVHIATDTSSLEYIYVESCLERFEEVSSDVFKWEFFFHIKVEYLEDPESIEYIQNRAQAVNFIPESIRKMVVPIVVNSLDALLDEVSPDLVYRVTKAVDPHPKAMKKHHDLTGCLQRRGYVLHEDGADPLGRWFWVFRNPGLVIE